MRVIKTLQCSRPLYVGDSRDDFALVENARSAGIDCDFCYISKTMPPWPGVDITIESVTELFKIARTVKESVDKLTGWKEAKNEKGDS